MTSLHKTSLLTEQWRGKLFKGPLIPDMHSHPGDRGGLDCIRITSEQHNRASYPLSTGTSCHRQMALQWKKRKVSPAGGQTFLHLIIQTARKQIINHSIPVESLSHLPYNHAPTSLQIAAPKPGRVHSPPLKNKPLIRKINSKMWHTPSKTSAK